ncbi:hypothetical protein BV25DRAFT_1922459 [Artomyces pyxidatus]|uniref:Uncharacterized protein n=1 Tax=Artomyces pyxidatus TaxID=48021 RepID=A0ACB8SEQ1_9AGAM|nr:hypothetical protein BV25DRAFT_1922459 [Artomyces pyxidatus]
MALNTQETKQSRRKSYQDNYNKTKRIAGRRKVSKWDRYCQEAAERAVSAGRKRAYTNSIAHKHQNSDPERTLYIHGEEEEAWNACIQLRQKLIAEFPEDWVQKYVTLMRAEIDRLREEAEAFKDADEIHDFRGSSLHKFRRLIACHHQEIEFSLQGLYAYERAEEDNAFIFGGRRVHKPLFRKLYGF